MLSEKFYEVLKYEGVVSIVSWGNGDANITNTWNSYLVVKDNKIMLPAAGMNSTEKDVNVNNRVKVTLGAREVMGYNNYQGTGFLIEGTAEFIESGEDYQMMKEKFPFLRKVLEISVVSAKQLL
ncbi:MAG: pyridoxamine 5'-phosphate oxidase family protein [Fusobacterium gastrosuis]|uniref:pyridoxamine 5'-phosphate oxidase family protein n=1 Tax=Fusobacterium TaxID=848 RepID=UPI0025C6E333|nr:pyridoxamine 5'-phosphate oxidase family protein [Fusobacterium sp.]MDD7410307.1 pyridoxamine 5'-phosphate oxidase family protein [Fusobacteriaceae bacterium]MDY4011116.1 pyridoxamine 5'-phosphate oxidase family protein [Fusobacterium gastrosuis]MCI5725194.1 pyridoxamine 5'-phosphate oxidase family protein [Fusobacterium sp.]MCI7223669.1 pyridoxamine 5'-phosphate oxidase family protein [Fusobacterium sp.]MDY5306221.1 pyridoxamine 5'-phosphate oxidase family protein [Fusobacterium gastrosuis